jgi:hypothetical protein
LEHHRSAAASIRSTQGGLDGTSRKHSSTIPERHIVSVYEESSCRSPLRAHSARGSIITPPCAPRLKRSHLLPYDRHNPVKQPQTLDLFASCRPVIKEWLRRFEEERIVIIFKQAVFSIAFAVLAVAVAEYVMWILDF